MRAEQGASTYLSGSIEDAQAKFNLRNLVSTPTPGLLIVNVQEIASFQRLLMLLGLDGSLAKTVALQIRAGLAQSGDALPDAIDDDGRAHAGKRRLPRSRRAAAPAAAISPTTPVSHDADSNAPVAPLQMINVESLLDVPGFTPEAVDKLRPFVTVLPTTTSVNMNTASAEVIAATVPGMNLSQAQEFVARRETVFFHDVSNVQLALTGAGVKTENIDATQMDVTTNYFLIHGRVQHERSRSRSYDADLSRSDDA